MDIIIEDRTYIANTYSRFPICITRGDGALLYDDSGKEYIDLGSGIAVNTFGAADGEWAEAVAEQAATLQHTSNLFYSEPCVRLAKMLCERSGMKKVFFSNSGAEANECAIKAARRRAFLKYGDESHSTIITLKNSFHGRTVTTLAATGQASFHTEFGPFTPGFVYADPSDPASLEKLAEEHGCAAIMFETIQGEGGVVELSAGFIDAIKHTAAKHDLLIVVDEVQTGNGRTGDLFSYMYAPLGLKPDIVSTAKGLAGGLPLGATLFGERTADVYTPGTHGSTFGGNPVCCAAAISVLSRLTGELLDGVRCKGEYIRSQLEGAQGIKSVSGRGLMLGIEIERPTAEVIAECRERGVLILSAKTKLRLLPPLIITDKQLKKAVTIIKEVCAQ